MGDLKNIKACCHFKVWRVG